MHLAGDQADEGKSVVRLRITGNPGRPEGVRQRDRYMVKLDKADFHDATRPLEKNFQRLFLTFSAPAPKLRSFPSATS